MFQKKDEDIPQIYDAHEVYDYQLLKGHFKELDNVDNNLILSKIKESEELFQKSGKLKGQDKINQLILSFISYATTFALFDKCEIDEIEGIFSFVCIRHPELDFNWQMMQKIILASKNNKVDYSEQKTLELALILYTSAIKEALNKNK